METIVAKHIDKVNEFHKKYGKAIVLILNSEDTEYIRVDVFTEKVCDWLSDTLQTIEDVECTSIHHVETLPVLGSITLREFLDKFREEIKYLFD